MRAVLAISGGVDSMVMLDMLVKMQTDNSTTQTAKPSAQFETRAISSRDFIVAHLDHGTRPSSRADAEFVARRAQEYNLPFIAHSLDLGEHVAEEVARKARYEFLHQVRIDYNCDIIYTAHHLDDLVESITINLLRGTGWRGLAVLDSPYVRRPLLEMAQPLNKRNIYQYAAEHRLPFRQDPTNSSDEYLRNRIRPAIAALPDENKNQLYQLWRKQKQLKSTINELVQELLPTRNTPWQRRWFQELAPEIALELLRAATLSAGISATRPQLENFRQAILTYTPGKYFNLPDDKLIKLNKTTFCL